MNRFRIIILIFLLAGCIRPYKSYYKKIAIQQQSHDFILGETALDVEVLHVSHDVLNQKFEIEGIIRSAGYERDGDIFRIKNGDTSILIHIADNGKFKAKFRRNEILKIKSQNQLDVFIRYCSKCVGEEHLRNSDALLQLHFMDGFNNDTMDLYINGKKVLKDKLLFSEPFFESTNTNVSVISYKGDCFVATNNFKEVKRVPCYDIGVHLIVKINNNIYEYNQNVLSGRYIKFKMVNGCLNMEQSESMPAYH